MFRTEAAIAILGSMLAVTGCAGSAPAVYSLGILVDPAGMTLYTFDKDPAGKSVCNDKCAANWPPLKASAGARPGGEFGIITRDDGSKQWAYKGMPLYLWIKDLKPGDMSGDGVNNVWHVVKEDLHPVHSGD